MSWSCRFQYTRWITNVNGNSLYSSSTCWLLKTCRVFFWVINSHSCHITWRYFVYRQHEDCFLLSCSFEFSLLRVSFLAVRKSWCQPPELEGQKFKVNSELSYQNKSCSECQQDVRKHYVSMSICPYVNMSTCQYVNMSECNFSA